MEEVYYVNGRWVRPEDAVVSVEDRGFQLGDGIYEVIRVYGGRPFALSRHLDRLAGCAREIELPLPVPLEEIGRLVAEAVSRRGLGDAQVYVQVTRGAAPRVHYFPPQARSSLVVYASAPRVPSAALYRDGAEAVVVADQRWLRCDIKSINLLANSLAKEHARRAGALEAVFEREGVGITEGASSNVFVVQKGRLVTPPAGPFLLRGVTRQLVLELAAQAGVPVVERFFSRGELYGADEAFLTSTMMEIMPLVRVDGRTIGAGRPGELTGRLHEALREMVRRGLP